MSPAFLLRIAQPAPLIVYARQSQPCRIAAFPSGTRVGLHSGFCCISSGYPGQPIAKRGFHFEAARREGIRRKLWGTVGSRL